MLDRRKWHTWTHATMAARQSSIHVILAAMTLALVSVLFFGAGTAGATVWSSQTAFSRGIVVDQGQHWVGVRATIEVQSGTMASDDQAAGGYISERVKAHPHGVTYPGIEVGYCRKRWDGVNFQTRSYHAEHHSGGLYMSSVGTITLGNHIFELLHTPDNGWAAWAYYIDGGQVWHGIDYFWWTDEFVTGLSTNASSAGIASASDNINVSNMKKLPEGGSIYSFGPAGSYDNSDPNAGTPRVHGDWDTAGQTSHNRRADN